MRDWKKSSIRAKVLHQDICLRYRNKVKNELFTLLGNKCVVCGYTGLALQLEHVNNNGREDVKKIGKGFGTSYYSVVIERIKKGSKDYQLMCANHNMEKELERRLIEREKRREEKLKGIKVCPKVLCLK
jgi:hypothetical protein